MTLATTIRTLALATSLSLLLAAPATHAAIVTTSQAGGGGGTAFTQTCPNGAVLTGLQGAFGDFVDSVKPVCVTIDSLGDAASSSVLSAHGGSGGTTGYDLECPRGWAVTGLKGRSGLFVDRVQLVCAPVQLDGTVLLSAERTDPFKAGGSGGSAFSIHCGGTRPARGINGGAGSFVDRIGLGCENAGLTTVAQTSNTLPDFRVVTRDLPFKVVKNSSVTYDVSMWDIGGADAPTGSSMDLVTNFPISFPTIVFNFQTCDFNDPPPLQGHFLRCFTTRPTHPFALPPMDIEVTFTAGTTGSFNFGGFANQDGGVTTAHVPFTRLGGLKVVDSTGTAGLSPVAASVRPHEHFDYTVTWTVPSPLTWNDLRDVQLRISDDENPLLWVRFDATDGRLRLLNSEGAQVGTAYLPGQRHRLKSDDATLFVKNSSVVGSGPDGQTITLNLDVSFSRRLANRALPVEVLADGPDGFEQLATDPIGTPSVHR